MALDYQILKIPLAAGIDTKADPKHLPVGKLSVLENARFDKAGTVNKRSGSVAVTEAVSDIVSMAANDDSYLFASSIALNQKTALNVGSNTKGVFRQWEVRTKPVHGKATTQTSQITACDYAYANGIDVYAWEDGTAIKFTAFDASGARVRSISQINGASEPRLVACGNIVHILYRGAANSIYAQYIDTTTGLLTGTATIATDYVTAGSGTYDVCADTSTAHFLVAWNITAAAGYKLGRFSGADGSVITAAVTRANYDNGVAVTAVPDGKIVVVSMSTTDVYADLFTSALAVSAGPTDIGNNSSASTVNSVIAKCKTTDLGGGVYGVYVLWHNTTADGLRGVIYKTDNTTTALAMFTNISTVALSIGSKWWQDAASGLMHACVKHDGGTNAFPVVEEGVNPTLFAVNENGDYMARALPGRVHSHVSDDRNNRNYFPASVIASSTNVYRTACVERESKVDLFDSTQALTRVQFTTDSGKVRVSAQPGGSTLFPGGFLWQFDGNVVAESGFLSYPTWISTVSSAAAGGLTSSVDYGYKVYYERRTARGEVERSACVGAITESMGVGHNTVVITVRPLITTQTRGTGDVVAAIYRTEANPGPDAIYYRVGSVDNNVASATLSFTDTTADLNLTDNAIDQFQSGELDHVAPNAAHIMCIGKDRVFLSDGQVVYYSKIRNPGEAVAFNDTLVIPVPSAGGEISGLAVMGELLIVFRERAIYYVAGDGPNNLGQGAFGSAQIVAVDVGCSDQRSIVLAPAGLMFKSSKGIYLLAQNLQTSYIGAAVEDYNSQDVTATLLVAGKNEVRFLTSSGSVLVYDYLAGQWGTDTGRAGVGILQVNGVVYYATSAGAVYSESGFTDNSAGYSMKATTGWVKVDALQGWLKVRRFFITGAYKSSGTVRVRVAYDYDDTFIDTYDYPLVNESPMRFRGRFSRMKCMAVKLEISDTSPTGEGFSLSEIAIEMGRHPGGARLPADHSVNES